MTDYSKVGQTILFLLSQALRRKLFLLLLALTYKDLSYIHVIEKIQFAKNHLNVVQIFFKLKQTVAKVNISLCSDKQFRF